MIHLQQEKVLYLVGLQAESKAIELLSMSLTIGSITKPRKCYIATGVEAIFWLEESMRNARGMDSKM